MAQGPMVESGAGTSNKVCNSTTTLSDMTTKAYISPAVDHADLYPRGPVVLNDQCAAQQPKFIVVLVGLPAVGKSTVAKELVQYLNSTAQTSSLRCHIFNAGDIRRQMCVGSPLKIAGEQESDLFDPKNSSKRDEFAKIAMVDLLQSVDEDHCDVALFDATNSTIKRRRHIFDDIALYNSRKESRFSLSVIVLQISCTDPDMVRYNIHRKSYNKDYSDKPYAVALKDFAKRLEHYYESFIPFTEKEFDRTRCTTFTADNFGFFNLVNNGLTKENKNRIELQGAGDAKLVITVYQAVAAFIDNYYTLYGKSYVDAVKQFYEVNNANRDSSTKKGISPAIMDQLNRLNILRGVINEPYFKKLKHLKKLNLRDLTGL